MELYVYCPYYDNWNDNMFLSDVFVPWILTWLNTYEFWLVTGTWNYDEIHPKKRKRKR